MKAALGVFSITVSLLGILFFRNYQGSAIPFPFIWVTALAALGAFGFWLLYLSQKERMRKMAVVFQQQDDLFKEQAKRVELDFDKCEFRNGSYAVEPDQYLPAAEALDSRNNSEIIDGSYLVYSDMINGKKERFVSQVFPFDQPVLKLYVMNKKLGLYIAGPGSYFFELND